jgi:hypothetical protein
MSSADGRPRDEMDDLVVPMLVRLAGGLCMVTGAFTLGLAIQTGLMFRMSGKLPVIIALMIVLGLAAVVTGWGTSQARGHAAVGGTVASGLVATLGSLWAVTGLLSGVVSPLSFGVVFLGVGSAVLAGLAIGPARGVTAARERLRAQGYDFGL